MEETSKNKLELLDRRRLLLEGVEHVESFDEKEIYLDTNMGALLLKGENMHITELNLEEGKMSVDGYIAEMRFSEEKVSRGAKDKGKSVLSRIFK